MLRPFNIEHLTFKNLRPQTVAQYTLYMCIHLRVQQRFVKDWQLLDSVQPFPFLRPEEKQEPAKVVKYLHSTEDGESCEETHRASNKAKLTFQGDFLVTFNLVVSCRVKVNQNVLELHNSIQRMRT